MVFIELAMAAAFSPLLAALMAGKRGRRAQPTAGHTTGLTSVRGARAKAPATPARLQDIPTHVLEAALTERRANENAKEPGA